MTPIIMPQVGQDIPAGKIVQWLKEENDPVETGEVLLIVESEKASFEVEAEQSGVLLRILHQEGEEVEILKPIGYIGSPGEEIPQVPTREGEPQVEDKPKEKPLPAERQPVAREGEVLASPAARRIAREKGIDLSEIIGSGPGGRITKKDVLSHPGALPSPEGGEDTVIPFGKMRRRIAQRLTQSKQTIPHFYIMLDVDMTAAQQWRASFNTKRGAHITVTDLIIHAAASALRKFPRLNAHVTGESITVKKDINIGVAVAIEDGLLVPVIPNTDQMDLLDISSAARKNAEDARRGMMKPEPVGTFTITSLGMHGVSKFIPIINPPECAILSAGAIESRAVPVDTATGVRQMMTLTLACDHRAVDGTDAAGLLNEIKRNLEQISEIESQKV